VFEKGIVDHGLIVVAAFIIHFGAKPFQNFVIDAYSYPGLPGKELFYRPQSGLTKMVSRGASQSHFPFSFFRRLNSRATPVTTMLSSLLSHLATAIQCPPDASFGCLTKPPPISKFVCLTRPKIPQGLSSGIICHHK
jgi:hypothetical protein